MLRFKAVGFFLLVPCILLAQIRPGAERMDQYLHLLKGKRVGIIANRASVVNGMNIVDTLLLSGVKVQKIFSPEHGFRGFVEAGQNIENFSDPQTGLPVISLYGNSKKPTVNDLKDLDIMIFDIQDVGVRFFTYISTLTCVMEACAENHLPMILLDRPNPNGFYIDGPVLEFGYRSFIGMHPVPIVYGMTIGEYAGMVNGQGWLKGGIRCKITVIRNDKYSHRYRYMLPAKPSPNLFSMNAVYLYPSLCLFEGTMMSVGRGTLFPFEVFGHPDWKSCSFTYVPKGIQDVSLHPLYEGLPCLGIDLRGITLAHPEYLGSIQLSWLIAAYADLGSNPDFFNDYFDKLAGTSKLKNQIIQGLPEEEIKKTWQNDLARFKQIRSKYLLYPD